MRLIPESRQNETKVFCPKCEFIFSEYKTICCPNCECEKLKMIGKDTMGRNRYSCQNDKCSTKTFNISHRLSSIPLREMYELLRNSINDLLDAQQSEYPQKIGHVTKILDFCIMLEKNYKDWIHGGRDNEHTKNSLDCE